MRLVARSVSTCDKRRHLAYNRIESLEGAPIGWRRICNRSWSQLDVWKCWEKPQIIISWCLSWSSFSISFHHFPLFNGHKLGRTPLVTQIRPAEAWWIFGPPSPAESLGFEAAAIRFHQTCTTKMLSWQHMGMGQNPLLSYLGESTSMSQLFQGT